MSRTFGNLSYLSQVRSLRKLAKEVLKNYQIKVRKISFIHHGENTTFRIESLRGRFYLLRIHRSDYHTKAAIVEELNWLLDLAQKGFDVPNPLKSKNGQLVETVENQFGARNCTIFHWIQGQFIRKSINTKHLFEAGVLIGNLHNNRLQKKSKHREYWTAEGLAGNRPRFGSIDQIPGISQKQQKIISNARKRIFKKLKSFEKSYPDRLGYIHADLHFGNMIFNKGVFGAIDFDDSGVGFFAYDLAVTYIAAQNALGETKADLLPVFKSALIEGYKSKRQWDHADEKIFDYLVTARKLLMLGWLNSRSDNPRLRNHLKGAVEKALLHLKSTKPKK